MPLVAQAAKNIIPALGMAAVTGVISGATHKSTSDQGMRNEE